MSDTVVTLNNKSQPIPIQYTKSCHGFSDSNNDTNRYLFELVINGEKIGKKYFRNLEDDKYSHLIKLIHKIPLSNIESYKANINKIKSVHFESDEIISKEINGSIINSNLLNSKGIITNKLNSSLRVCKIEVFFFFKYL